MPSPILDVARDELQKIKKLADKSIAQLDDDAALGQARSRGEQHRDADAPHGGQHAIALDRLSDLAMARSPIGIAIRSSRTCRWTAPALLAEWEDGWRRVFEALDPLTDADLQETSTSARSRTRSTRPSAGRSPTTPATPIRFCCSPST